MASVLKVNEIQHTGGTSALTIDSNGVIKTPARPIFQVGLTANQSVSNATITQINFNDKTSTYASGNGSHFDIGGYFNTSNSRYLPLVAGYYFVVVSLRIEGTTPDYLQCYIKKNGQTIRFNTGVEGNAANSYVDVHTSTIVQMNGSSDYLTIDTYHNYGSARNILSTGGQTQFGGYLIG
jgi:hypothetical protein